MMDFSILLHQPAFYVAVITLPMMILLALETSLGNRSLKYLNRVEPQSNHPPPKVSIIIAARNEQRNIEEALRSVLVQDYKNLEVIVVDDRSTDTTGVILDRMASQNPRLKIVSIRELPAGWLGKNHALWVGAKQSTGELLLFSDADVVMDPTVVSRAITYLEEKKLDHLPITPTIKVRGIVFNMLIDVFILFFGFYARPWKVSDPNSQAHIGIGAFNLIRKEVYEKIGTHQVIAMRPDDDMKLGRLVKKHGFRQELLLAPDLMSVEWYSSLREAVRGLMKNSFTGTEYRLDFLAGVTLINIILLIWPFAGLFLTHGLTQGLNILIVCIILLLSADNVRFHGLKSRYCLGFPFAALLFFYILWRAAILTLYHDGIDWRGTHYSLKELRANKV